MTHEFLENINAGVLRFNNYEQLVEGLYLPAIVDSFARLKKVAGIGTFTENQIRNYLVFDLENHNDLLSPFIQSKILKLTKENTLLISPTETKRTDFEFFISGFGDFVIECKSLRSAEYRYIGDGLNRFVEEAYSENDDRAAMLGFIVAGKPDSIVSNLKERIKKETSYQNNILLQNICIGFPLSFHSTHIRQTKPAIILYHFFVSLS